MRTAIVEPVPARGDLEISPPAFVFHSVRETMRLFGTRLLPHDTRRTTCPPAPLVPGDGPLIIVPSLMRSGTHLLLDALFNNFPALRRRPLFVDFDACERAGRPPEPFATVNGITIKTHYPQVELGGPYLSALKSVAARALILMPRRPAAEIRKSLAKWGENFTAEEFAEIERRFDAFWGPFSPVTINFPTLLESGGVESLIALVSERTGLAPGRNKPPVMPARHRSGIYFDKVMTRLLGRGAPRINTTIGYRLVPRQRA
ncbi:MAG TPA: hypothetical protein VN048_11040 [Verrucomicrobiae bacterium]|jgi:hypothetical protein|nr:hypothetical protein [Verrucomicrobiae bacterium]